MPTIAGTLPEIVYREYDVEDIYKAIEKNGFEHLRGAWVSPGVNNGKAGGCAIGQAALNLNVATNYDHFENGEAYSNSVFDDVDDVTDFDDYDAAWREFTLYEQLYALPYDGEWYEKIVEIGIGIPSATCASTIIWWNDAVENGGTKENKDNYRLKTYQEVSDMCRDVLSPHFGTKIKVIEYDYEKYGY